MATTIKLKNSVTTTNTPSSLEQGEVAINVTDRKVWVGNAATTPVQLLGAGATGSFSALSCTTLTASGVATFSAGTVSAPAITTTGDTNTGIFFPAADTIAFTEGGVEAMRIDSSGRLGIGTTSPAYKVDAVVASGSDAYFADGNTQSFSGYRIRAGASGQQWAFRGGNTTMSLSDVTAGADRLVIDSAGNVGIGTSSPAVKLDVNKGSEGEYLRAGGDDTGTNGRALRFTSSTGGGFIGAMHTLNAPSSGGTIAFATNSTERMRITSGGEVLIGDTATGAYFDGNLNVFKSGNIPMCVKIGTVAAWNISCWSTPTSGDNQFLVFGTEGTFNARGSITYNRTAGLTAYNTTSDQRLKDNIVDASSALSKIDSVKIRSFDWKETGNHVDFGVIAQELIIVAPECVTKGQDNDDGTIKNAWSVDTSALIPALVKAIQELKTTVDAQAARIAALESN
jgi:hypothetical protein